MDNVPGVREAAEKSEAIFGNIDAWLIWQLTGGPNGGVHVTDVTNASRTMLMDLENLAWDDGMLDVFGVHRDMLPEIRSSSEVYGYTAQYGPLKRPYRFPAFSAISRPRFSARRALRSARPKTLMGTGCFLLMNTGEKIVNSTSGLITTVGYRIGDEPAVYALEGSIAIGGSLVQWFSRRLRPDRDVPSNRGTWRAPCPTTAAFTSSRRFPGCSHPTGEATPGA